MISSIENEKLNSGMWIVEDITRKSGGYVRLH